MDFGNFNCNNFYLKKSIVTDIGVSIKYLPRFKCKVCDEMIPYRPGTFDNGNSNMVCDGCSDEKPKATPLYVATPKKDEGWPMGWKLSVAVCIALYFFSFISDGKDEVLSIVGAIFFGTILGSFAYLIGGLIWGFLTEIFKSSKDYAQKKGVPTPFAVIFGLFCGYLFLELIG